MSQTGSGLLWSLKGDNMIITTIDTPSALRSEFESYGRHDQFSYSAYDALHEFLWELSEGIGEPLQLDVIGLCCDWCEFDEIRELAEAYGITLEYVGMTAADDEDDIETALASELRERGELLAVSTGSWLFSG
jgi:hypothetical protein